MKLIIDLGGQQVEELHPSEALARAHLSIVLKSHKSRGHYVAQSAIRSSSYSRYLVQTPEGRLQYWLER
jgi:hypothetical protein